MGFYVKYLLKWQHCEPWNPQTDSRNKRKLQWFGKLLNYKENDYLLWPLKGSIGTCPGLFQVQERHWKVPQCPKWTIVSTGEQRWHKSPKTWGIQWCFEACVWQVWAHITEFYTLLISHDPHPRDGGSTAHTAPVGRTPSRRLTDADLPEMHKWLFFVPPASLQSPWQHMVRVRGGIVEAERGAA